MAKFTVKKVKLGRGPNAKRFYKEVGRLTIRETDKGTSGSLYLHMLEGEGAVFPVEPKDEKENPRGPRRRPAASPQE